MTLTDPASRTSPASAHKGATGHGEDSSPLKEERDGDQDTAADANNATGRSVDETDRTGVESRLPGPIEGDSDVASVFPTKRKLPLLATGGSAKNDTVPQSRRKRRRRHRFSAPALSDEELNTEKELDTSNETSGSVYMPRGSSCEPARGQRPPRPSHLLQRGHRFEKSQSRRPCPESSSSSPLAPCMVDRAVVFEQQRWRGKIINERHVKQGRGRPRKQYLIDWEPSWVDSGRLGAPGLIEDWEENGREGA